MSRVLLVSNRLPISASVEAGELLVRPSSGGLATGLRGLRDRCDARWIGWPGDLPELTPAQREELDTRLAADGARPVFLTPEETDGFYRSISTGVLWPLFHYLLDHIPLHVRGWDVFRAVNQKFADAAAAEYEDGDFIWVHDYHLMLVPAMLRQRLPQARIGFFLHIPFPSSEVFSVLPWREEILRGLLGADLVGFHAAAYLRHFTTSLRRLLGLQANVDRVHHDGRDVGLGVFPMGVDAEAWEERAMEPGVLARAAEIRGEANGNKLIVGIDRLDYTKGLPQRLLAVEQLLEGDASLRERVRMVQVTVPSREGVDAYATFRDEIDGIVGRINSTYATPSSVPIHHMHHALSEREVAALYRSADVMLVTPLRDGMNLVAKEFVASRADNDGVLVLSEFAGAASELGEALRVNPYDVDSIAHALRHALELPPEERASRMRAMRSRVRDGDVHRWATGFLNALQAVAERRPGVAHAGQADPGALIRRLQDAGPLVLVLDYDGTLVPFASTPDAAIPDPELLHLLRGLALRDDTDVHIVTGRSRRSIDRWLGALPIAISAEHGLWSRPQPNRPWQLQRPVSVRWKRRLRPIMEHFVNATPGSFIEEKTASLAWHYRRVEDDFGEQQARELRLLLGELLSSAPVEVVAGHKVVEIKAQGVTKATAVETLLRGIDERATVVAIGDDASDEACFAALPPDSITVHVNGGLTKAAYTVDDPSDVRRLLTAVLRRPHHELAAIIALASAR